MQDWKAPFRLPLQALAAFFMRDCADRCFALAMASLRWDWAWKCGDAKEPGQQIAVSRTPRLFIAGAVAPMAAASITHVNV